MKALLQRVDKASVSVSGKLIGVIGKGICLFLGVFPSDTDKDIEWMADKSVNLRIFDDANGKMNLSLSEVNGEMLVVSQFTLCGDCSRGRRPSWHRAAPPEFANEMYKNFVKKVVSMGIKTATGQFQAFMKVNISNNGPVTLLLDSRE